MMRRMHRHQQRTPVVREMYGDIGSGPGKLIRRRLVERGCDLHFNFGMVPGQPW